MTTTWMISSRNDIETWIANHLPEADVQRAADAIQAADHPAWGRDWTAWLEEHAAELAAATRCSGIEVRRYNGQCEFGAWLASDEEDEHGEIPPAVYAAVADELAQQPSVTSGEVDVGGSRWRWRRAAETAS